MRFAFFVYTRNSIYVSRHIKNKFQAVRQATAFSPLIRCTSDRQTPQQTQHPVLSASRCSSRLGENPYCICWRTLTMKMYYLPLLLITSLVPAVFAQNTSSPYYHKFYDLESKAGWSSGYALLSPSWSICSSCSPTASRLNWYRTTGHSSPAVDGNSTRHHIGGTRPYSDILWNNHLVGSFSSVGLPDYSNTLTKGAHNFI